METCCTLGFGESAFFMRVLQITVQMNKLCQRQAIEWDRLYSFQQANEGETKVGTLFSTVRCRRELQEGGLSYRYVKYYDGLSAVATS